MNREQIIEALSRNYAKRFGGFGPTMEADIERANKTWPRYVHEMEATLTALETAIPGLADVIAGKAVVVPVEPTEAMYAAACDPQAIFKHTKPEERGGKIPLFPAVHYRAMIEARPK